jgi:hypothetical protein
MGDEGAQRHDRVARQGVGSDALWWRRPGEDTREPGGIWFARWQVKGLQNLTAGHAGAVRVGIGTGQVPPVVGMPGQRAVRADLPAGVPPGQYLDRDDAAGPVADDVGEATRRGMVPQVADGLIQGACGLLEPAGDEVPAGARAR